MKSKIKLSKRRNLAAMSDLMRKGGAHNQSKKYDRSATKRSLRKEWPVLNVFISTLKTVLSTLNSQVTQLAEWATVNRLVDGSNPSLGAN